MIKVEVFMTIWVLHQQGASVREIARRLSVSRNTVRRYLRGGEEMPRYVRRSGRPSKLDGVRAYLEQRIDQALPHRLPATVLFREALALYRHLFHMERGRWLISADCSSATTY